MEGFDSSIRWSGTRTTTGWCQRGVSRTQYRDSVINASLRPGPHGHLGHKRLYRDDEVAVDVSPLVISGGWLKRAQADNLGLSPFGAVAQPGRAPDWQSGGQGFKSPQLHTRKRQDRPGVSLVCEANSGQRPRGEIIPKVTPGSGWGYFFEALDVDVDPHRSHRPYRAPIEPLSVLGSLPLRWTGWIPAPASSEMIVLRRL